MAAIGDVLVKFVADFAEFSANMGKSQKDIESWAQSIAKAGQSVEGFISLAKRAFAALAIAEAIKDVVEFNDRMQKAGEGLAAFSLRSDAAARSVRGVSEESVKLAELYKDAGAEWTQDYLQRVQKAQSASEDFGAKSFVLGQRLHNLYLELTQRPGDDGGLLEWGSQKANELFDWIEKLVPTINHTADVFILQMQAMAKGVGVLIDALKDSVGWLDKMAQKAWDARGAVRDLLTRPVVGGPRTTPNVPGSSGAFGMFDDQGNAQSAAEYLRQQQETQQRLGRLYGRPSALPISLAAADNPPPPAAAGGGGGGRGATADDTIDKQIARYKAMGEAADKAYKTINEGADQQLEDLQRQVKAQQQADDITAKLLARGQKVTEDQKKALYETVLATEQKIAAEQKLIQVENDAVATDKKYGDGTISLNKLHKDLSDQLKTGRITQEDFNRATTEGAEAIEQAALAAKRYDDDLGSLAAGFQHAANAAARSNDMYSLGEQAFTQLSSSMTEGLKALEGQSSKTFGQIAVDFANMLADMAFRAAASQAFKLLVGSLGGSGVDFISPGSGGFAAAGGLNTYNAAAGLPLIPGLAGGGPVSAGKPYMVGEQGPEYFVPSAAGNIVPMGQAGNGGGVTVNVDMSGGGGTNDPNQAVEFGRRVKQAVTGVIQNEQRPGGTLYQRKSA